MNPYHALLDTAPPTASLESESDTPILYTDADLEEMAQRILPKTSALSRSTKLPYNTPYNQHIHRKKLSLSLPALVGHALRSKHMVTSSNPVSRRASLQSAIRRASCMSGTSTPERAEIYGRLQSAYDDLQEEYNKLLLKSSAYFTNDEENTPEDAGDNDHSYVLKFALDHTDTTITVDGLDLADLRNEEVEEGGEDVDSQDSTWVTRGSVGSCGTTTNNKRNTITTTTNNNILSMKAVVKSILEQHHIQVEALVKCKQELFYHYQTQYDNACQLREKINYMKGHNSDLLDQEREKYMLLHDEYMILKEATNTATATPLMHPTKVTTHIKPTVLQMISPKFSGSAAKKPGAGNTTNTNTYDVNLCDFNEDDDTATVHHTATTMHDNDENKSPTNCLSIYSSASTNTNTASTVLKKPVRPLDDKLQVPGLLPKFTLHMPSLEESLLVHHVAIPPTDTDLFTYSAPNTGKEGHNYDLNDDDMYEVSSPNIHSRDRLSCLTPNEPVDSATTSLISSKLQCIRDLNLTSLFSKICAYRNALSITEKNDISTLISEIQDEIKLIQELDIHERDESSKLMRELQHETNTIMTEKNELLVTIERSAIEYLNSSGEFYAERRKLHDRIASLEYLSSQLQLKLEARGDGNTTTTTDAGTSTTTADTEACAELGTPLSECDTLPAVHDQHQSYKDAALTALQVEYEAIQAQRDDLTRQLHTLSTDYTTLQTKHTETLSHLTLLEQQLDQLQLQQQQSPYNQQQSPYNQHNNDQTDELELLNKRVLELTNVLEHLQNTTNIEKTLLKSRILKLNTQMNVIRDENIIERDCLLSEINALKACLAYNNTTNDNNDDIHDNSMNNIIDNSVYNSTNNNNNNLYTDNDNNKPIKEVVVEEDEIPSPRNTEISIILMELADIKKDRSALKETVKNQLHMLNTLKIESDEDLFNLQLSHEDEIKEVSDRLIVIEAENKRISYENNVLIKQVDALTLQLVGLQKDKADLITQLQSTNSLMSHTVRPEINTIPPPTAAPVAILHNTTTTTATVASKSKGEQIYANLVQTKAWQREKLVYEEKVVILNRQYDECKVECEDLRRQLRLQQGRQVREEEEEDKREVLYSILGTSSPAPSYPTTTQIHTHTNTATSGVGIAFPSNQSTSNYAMKDTASSPISTHTTTNSRTTTTPMNTNTNNTTVSARKSVVKLKPVTDSKVILQKIKKLDEKLNSPNKDNNNTNTTNNKKTHYSRSRKTKNGRRDTNLWFEDKGHNSDRHGNNSNGNEFLRAHREIAEMWARQYQALIEYKNVYGHCNVPYTYVHDCESVPLGKKEVIGSVVSRLNLGQYNECILHVYSKNVVPHIHYLIHTLYICIVHIF